jgi:hypothetical protein
VTIPKDVNAVEYVIPLENAAVEQIYALCILPAAALYVLENQPVDGVKTVQEHVWVVFLQVLAAVIVLIGFGAVVSVLADQADVQILMLILNIRMERTIIFKERQLMHQAQLKMGALQMEKLLQNTIVVAVLRRVWIMHVHLATYARRGLV